MKRKLKKKNVLIAILLITIIITITTVGIVNFLKDDKTTPKEIREEKTIKESGNNLNQESTLSLVMVGDVLIHSSVYADAKTSKGGYDFTKMFTEVKDSFKDFDLLYYNQETILGGTSIGLSTYPMFNSPQEVGDAMVDMNFNLVSLATNHTLDRGKVAIKKSLDYWKKQEGVIAAGSYASEKDRDNPVIMEKNGITYTMLSYTTLTNGLIRPSDEPYLLNIYNEEQVKRDVENIRDKVDVLMVAMHWGAEYTHTPVPEEVKIAKYLASLDVDIVIGTHPHVIQPIEFIDDTMIVYSLGNFISAQIGIEKLVGLMASVTIRKTVVNGNTTISLEKPTADLVYTSSNTYPYRSNFKLYPFSKLNNTILPNYKTYYEKYMNIATGGSDLIEKVPLS